MINQTKILKIGDLVTMDTHDTGMIGIITHMNPRGAGRTALVGIHWFGGSGITSWEPHAWLRQVTGEN